MGHHIIKSSCNVQPTEVGVSLLTLKFADVRFGAVGLCRILTSSRRWPPRLIRICCRTTRERSIKSELLFTNRFWIAWVQNRLRRVSRMEISIVLECSSSIFGFNLSHIIFDESCSVYYICRTKNVEYLPIHSRSNLHFLGRYYNEEICGGICFE